MVQPAWPFPAVQSPTNVIKRTSENAQKAKFAEFTFYEVRE